jgi:hypothetical protein
MGWKHNRPFEADHRTLGEAGGLSPKNIPHGFVAEHGFRMINMTLVLRIPILDFSKTLSPLGKLSQRSVNEVLG